MERALKSFLEDSGLPHLCEFSDEQDVTLEILQLATRDELKELVPKLTDRIKLRNALEHLQDYSYDESPTSPVAKLIKQAAFTIAGPSQELDSEYIDNQDIHEHEPEISPERSPESPERTATPEPQDTIKVDKNQQKKGPSKESLDGRAIIREGQANDGLLSEGARRKLSQLIIFQCLESNPGKTITSDEFCVLAAEVCDIFRKEKAVIYYTPYQASTSKGQKKNASGKFYETYISRRRKLRAGGLAVGTSRCSSKSSVSSSVSSASAHIDDDNDEEFPNNFEDDLAWLKNNVDPWEEVEQRWTNTRDIRLKPITQGSGKIEEYYKDFPALKLPQGYRLLLQDFKFLYTGKEDNLFSKITLYKEKIIEYAREKQRTIRDKHAKQKIQEFLGLINDDDPETCTNAVLMLLPYIINASPARKQKNRPVWKPSRSEVAQGFVAQVANEGDVTSTIISKRESMLKVGRTLQPFVIFVGESATKVKRAYVVVNNQTYEFKKLITAVDCAFKLFQATGACYPDEAEDIWTFVQIGLYEIKTIDDRKTQAVNSILTDLELLPEYD